HQAIPFASHVAAYVESLTAQGATATHRDTVRRNLERLAIDCAFGRLADLKREALERWLAREASANRTARSRNAYQAALVSFCTWGVASGRLLANPSRGVPKADEKAAPRRRRRALTEAELSRLLDVARQRPLSDALTVRTGKGKGTAAASVRPEVRQH